MENKQYGMNILITTTTCLPNLTSSMTYQLVHNLTYYLLTLFINQYTTYQQLLSNLTYYLLI
jgi:hypothetical protein